MSNYRVIYDMGHTIDSIGYTDDFETAKNCAIDILCEWQTETINHYKMNFDARVWDEKQKEEWDAMIYNCGTFVEEYNEELDEWDCVYEPMEDLPNWCVYEELVKGE